MSGSYYTLDAKYNTLLALITANAGIDLEQVLTNGDDANGLSIVGINDIALTTINGAAYPPVVAGDDLAQVLINGNSAGATDIDMSSRDILNGGTFTATTFVGDLTGNATTATLTTNIAGGAGGSIPYQSAVDTTALLANGTSGQVLTSQGTTLAPTWTTLSSGVSVNTISQIYNEDFIENPVSSVDKYPFNLSNNSNYTQGTAYDSIGRNGTAAISNSGGFSTFITTATRIRGAVSINSDQSGLGLTFIVSPQRQFSTVYSKQPNTRFCVGLNSAQQDFNNNTNSIKFVYDYNVNQNCFAPIIGDSPATTFFPSYNAGDFLVLRIVPLANNLGVNFYYYNETQGGASTMLTKLYSQQAGFTTTDANTGLFAGISCFATAPSGFQATIDYMGLQVATQRIYP